MVLLFKTKISQKCFTKKKSQNVSYEKTEKAEKSAKTYFIVILILKVNIKLIHRLTIQFIFVFIIAFGAFFQTFLIKFKFWQKSM